MKIMCEVNVHLLSPYCGQNVALEFVCKENADYQHFFSINTKLLIRNTSSLLTLNCLYKHFFSINTKLLNQTLPLY